MYSKKINQISDPLHGTIYISELEKNIISTQVFNRLHHVLQNSTAYLTYPSNKTSRFSHSIGVMHLGGEMFKYSLTNGDELVSKKLVDYIDGWISKLVTTNEDFRTEFSASFDSMHHYKQEFESLKGRSIDDLFYKANTPFLIPKDRSYSYTIAYQSVRVAALLHDLGHPPFSHITEDALDSIYATLQSKLDRKEKKLTQREESFYQEIGEYKKTSKDKLHEKLSKHLVENLFVSLISQIPMSNLQLKIFYIHIKFATLAILNDSTPEFKEVHKIVDGVIDCDRLDYVSRDPLASGLDDGCIEYERLTKTMVLVADETSFKFCASVKAMNTIEDFLSRRWKLYKQVILHHRVVKTDTLLFQVIRAIALEYLEVDSIEEDNESIDFVIPNDISGLWKTVSKSFNLTTTDYINHFIQWDDSWLLSCLRYEYFRRKHLTHEQGSLGELITIQLEELLSNKKYYSSLYKRFDGLMPLDCELVEYFDTSILDKLEGSDLLKSSISLIKEYKLVYQASKEKSMEWVTFIPYYGLFLVGLNDLFSNWGRDNDFNNLFKQSLNLLKEKYGILDFILKRNKLSTGLNEEKIIYDGVTSQSIQAFSRIEVELKSSKSVFPPFFIYFYARNGLSLERRQELITELGRTLASEVFKYFQNYKEE